MTKDLSDNTWSDLNFVKPGVLGAKTGANELTVYGVAGNATTIDSRPAPVLTATGRS